MAKKVIIVIVEGSSDETALIHCMRERFRNYKIKFEVQHGDALYSKYQNKLIKDNMCDLVKRIIKKRKYKRQDILAVLQITDTDGALIPDDSIVINLLQEEKTSYDYNCIRVNSNEQKINIMERNKKKSKNIKGLNSLDYIIYKTYRYQLFYFSRTLEHVLFNEANPAPKHKFHHVLDFVENLDISVEEYIKPFVPKMEAKGYNERYLESWKFIEEGENSLHRYTNVPLMFEYIDLISEAQK